MSPTRLKLPVEPEGIKKNNKVAKATDNNSSPRARHLLKKYGITDDQYTILYNKQGGRCAVCRRLASDFRYKLAIDHDHTTGEIRGLLCIHCNRYIVGRHRKERGAELLRAAFEYLTTDYSGWIVPPKIKKRRKKRKRK